MDGCKAGLPLKNVFGSKKKIKTHIHFCTFMIFVRALEHLVQNGEKVIHKFQKGRITSITSILKAISIYRWA